MTTDQSSGIQEVTASGQEIDGIVVKIEKALEGERIDHSIIGLIGLSIFLMNPRIETEKLEKAIEAVVTFTAMTVAAADMEQVSADKTSETVPPLVTLN